VHDCGGGLRFLRALYVMWVSQDLQVLRGEEMGLGDRVAEFVAAGWSLQRGFPRVGASVVRGGLR
jgi:hypothetical protein